MKSKPRDKKATESSSQISNVFYSGAAFDDDSRGCRAASVVGNIVL